MVGTNTGNHMNRSVFIHKKMTCTYGGVRVSVNHPIQRIGPRGVMQQDAPKIGRTVVGIYPTAIPTFNVFNRNLVLLQLVCKPFRFDLHGSPYLIADASWELPTPVAATDIKIDVSAARAATLAA